MYDTYGSVRLSVACMVWFETPAVLCEQNETVKTGKDD